MDWRSWLFVLGQILFTPLFSILTLLTFPLSRVQRNRIISLWARAMLFWLRLTCNIRYEVQGLERLPKQPCIILSKHQSAWETLAFQLIFPPQAYVMKRELLHIPFFGWGLAMTSPIAINRRDGLGAFKKLLVLGKARLQAGLWVVIFPEGARQLPNQRLGKFHLGGAYLACANATTVIPVAHNAGHFWPKNSLRKNAGVIQVRIGVPIDSRHLDAHALNTQVKNWIQRQMQELEACNLH